MFDGQHKVRCHIGGCGKYSGAGLGWRRLKKSGNVPFSRESWGTRGRSRDQDRLSRGLWCPAFENRESWGSPLSCTCGREPKLGQPPLAQHAWKPSDQPAWLTEKVYSEKVHPLLASMSASAIARQMSASRWYAGRIREGYRPHPRHWQTLAELAGISQ
jgi:hypothetical protein